MVTPGRVTAIAAASALVSGRPTGAGGAAGFGAAGAGAAGFGAGGWLLSLSVVR